MLGVIFCSPWGLARYLYLVRSSNDSSFKSSLAMTIDKGYGITEKGLGGMRGAVEYM